MVQRVFSMLAVVLLVASASQAGFILDQVTQRQADCSNPALASSPDGITMLAFFGKSEVILVDFIYVQPLMTVRGDTDDLLEPVLLGPGVGPVICWSRSGFHVAFASGSMVLIYHSDPWGVWNLDDYEMLPAGGEVMGLDILGIAGNEPGPDVMLTVNMSTEPPGGGHHVLYAERTSSGWSSLEDLTGEQDLWPSAQITWSVGATEPWPTIFYQQDGDGGMPNLHSITRNESTGWSAPLPVPGPGGPSPIMGFFDVLSHNGVNRNVLGMGLQPTCPCGMIHHQEYLLGGGWTEGENLTTHYAEYDWPRSPHLASGPEGNLHAFWIQQASGEDLMPLRNTLEYWVREDEAWTDEGASLNEPWPGHPTFGRVALAASPWAPPVLAWSRRDTIGGEPLPEQIWVARQPGPSAVPDPVPPRPKLSLTAWPNPFNASLTITFAVARSQPATLCVFDARGRRMADLLSRQVQAGPNEVTWQGRDNAGRNLPSGVYFVRLVVGEEQIVRKVVLAE